MSHQHHDPHVAGEEVGADRVAQLLAPPGRKVLVTTHRKPDGDAAGSMIGLTRILEGLGHDVVMWHVEGPGLPDDLAWLLGPDEAVVGGPVADHEERLVVSVDAATSHRMTDDDPSALGGPIINIDHHHDNPMWGHYNFVDGGASSSAEMVVRVADALGAEITREVALPLYVGLVTDTGRFSYGSTGAQAHAVAARLIDAGVDPAAVFRRVYEGVPFGDVRLVGRALAGARSELEGRLIIAVITDDDVTEAGGQNSDGVVEALRAVAGAEVAAVIRQVQGAWRVSVRASGDTVDVSAIAALEGGGGHRAAAGFTSQRDPDAIIALIRDAVVAQDG
ncbi:MAG: DHH family phosphoesterase [Thermoleophilia bacterium]|nr:DHH family phosphoesterase [Thermoleophilia bacterium]